MSGRVDVQSRARRSYRAVVIPTDALLTFGMLKLTSLMMEVVPQGRGEGKRSVFNQVFQPLPNTCNMIIGKQAHKSLLGCLRYVTGYQRVPNADCDAFDVRWLGVGRDRMCVGSRITEGACAVE